MRVVITGPGRAGTNFVTEVVRSSSEFEFTGSVEDRKLFDKVGELPDKYGTKLATENKGMNFENLCKLMDLYKDMHLVFVFRNPVANCMAKIYRGRPSSVGGDASNNTSSDGTVKTSIEAVKYSYTLYTQVKKKYSNRVVFVKLEDMLLNNKHTVKSLCKFLSIPVEDSMYNAYKNNRNTYQKKRYGNKLDISQASIYENWRSVYGGFFKNKSDQIKKLAEKLWFVAHSLGYSVERDVVYDKDVASTVVYTSGTIGDAFVQVCKLYNKALEGNLICRHYTQHKSIHDSIRNVFSLLPNTNVEFLKHRSDNQSINGSFIYINKEITSYALEVEYYPDFGDIDLKKFELKNKYVVVQLVAGAHKHNIRKLRMTRYNKIVESGKNIVVLGTDSLNITKAPNVLDLRNKTSIIELVGIVRGAEEFCGCQGFLSFVAVSQKVRAHLSVYGGADLEAIKHRIENTPKWNKYYKKVKG